MSGIGIECRVLCFVVFVIVLASAGAAQTAITPALAGEYNPATNLPQQTLGPEDLISLQVYGAPEFSRTVRVSADGGIKLPMIAAPIFVKGLLPAEAERTVAEALDHAGLLVNPAVTITVGEYHSRPVTVVGSVKTPTIFQVVGAVTLLDALARAGGLATDAGPWVIVTRNDQLPPQRIPLKPLIDATDPALNIRLVGNENVRVPAVLTMVIEGNVAHPGVYPVLDPMVNNTVTSAIAQAGGLAPFADHKAFIYRTDDNGDRHTLAVPLWEILQRRKQDVALLPHDTLYIPDSPRRRIAATTVQALTGVGTTAATTAIITRP